MFGTYPVLKGENPLRVSPKTPSPNLNASFTTAELACIAVSTESVYSVGGSKHTSVRRSA